MSARKWNQPTNHHSTRQAEGMTLYVTAAVNKSQSSDGNDGKGFIHQQYLLKEEKMHVVQLVYMSSTLPRCLGDTV